MWFDRLTMKRRVIHRSLDAHGNHGGTPIACHKLTARLHRQPHRTDHRTAMRRNRSTKIVATLGPATTTAERIREIFLAGADVFRLNFSHGTIDDHRARVDILRALEQEVGRPVAILMDLQGPKIRLGTFTADKATPSARRCRIRQSSRRYRPAARS
jgi:hypothetical protein